MTELKPGTIVKTKYMGGQLRTIAARRSGSDRAGKRAYAFTNGKWAYENEFDVIYNPASQPEKVKIPIEIARAIEHIRKERIESSEEILFMDVLRGTVPAGSGEIRRSTYILLRWAKESISNRKKYIQAITDGYERDMTPREKIVKGIQEGEMDRKTALAVLETIGGTFDMLAKNIRKDLDDDGCGAGCPVR